MFQKKKNDSSYKIIWVFDLNRSLQGFDKPGVTDVSFGCPNCICKKSITFDSLESLNKSPVRNFLTLHGVP